MQEVFFLVSCLCATEGARHELHAATGTERLVVLLHHVVCTQRSATDAAGAVGHKYLGTVLTDVTGALCRGRRHAHIRHFAGDTRAYLSHRLSPWACSPMLSYPTRSPGLLSAWPRRDRSATIAYLHHLMRLASPVYDPKRPAPAGVRPGDSGPSGGAPARRRPAWGQPAPPATRPKPATSAWAPGASPRRGPRRPCQPQRRLRGDGKTNSTASDSGRFFAGSARVPARGQRNSAAANPRLRHTDWHALWSSSYA